MVDIANTPHDQYSEYWKEQNRGGAEYLITLLDELGVDAVASLDLNDPSIRSEYGKLIHDSWISRNEWVKDPEYGDPVLAQEFDQLPKVEQDKDIDQLAILQRWVEN